MAIVSIAKQKTKQNKFHVTRKFRLTKLKKKLSDIQTTIEHWYYWTVWIIGCKNTTKIYKSYMKNKIMLLYKKAPLWTSFIKM